VAIRPCCAVPAALRAPRRRRTDRPPFSPATRKARRQVKEAGRHSELTIPAENWRARRMEAERRVWGGKQPSVTVGASVGVSGAGGGRRAAAVVFVFRSFLFLLLRWNIVPAPSPRRAPRERRAGAASSGGPAVGLVVTGWQGHRCERLSTARLRRPTAGVSRRGRSSGRTAAACRRPPPLRRPRVAGQPRGSGIKAEVRARAG